MGVGVDETGNDVASPRVQGADAGGGGPLPTEATLPSRRSTVTFVSTRPPRTSTTFAAVMASGSGAAGEAGAAGAASRAAKRLRSSLVTGHGRYACS